MGLTTVAGLTQETFDAIAAEMLIKADNDFVFLQQVEPQMGTVEPGAKTVTFNQPDLPTGTYTEASRRLTEGTAITANSKAITMSTKTLTLREYGGPYDGSAVTPFGVTEKLRKMAKHDVVPLIGQFMRRDRNKWLDYIRRESMLAATLVQTPDDSDEGVIAAGQGASAAWLRRMNKKMKDNLVPTFANGRWKLIITTQQEQELKTDPEIQAAFREFAAANPILQRGQLGFYENFDIYVDTLMYTKSVGSGGLITGQQSVAFGPYHLGTLTVMPPEIREADDTDFGRMQRIMWISIEAHGPLYVADYVVRGITT